MSKLPKIIIISGPTASGKTRFAIELAQALNGVIISADSMQVYRGLDIGTAKATWQEMAGIKHYIIDIVNPDEPYSVADFQRDARAAIAEVIAAGLVPIVVGGTGLYIQSLVFDYVFDTIEPLDYTRYESLTTEALVQRLAQLDPKTAENIDTQNRRRVEHALALAEQTDKTKSQREAQGQVAPLYDIFPLALLPERELLYERINARVLEMVSAGLVAETAYFNAKFVLAPQIKQAIGYRESLAYLSGEVQSVEAMIAAIQQNTRRFAKRQITWLNNQRVRYQFLAPDADITTHTAAIRDFLNE